MYAKRRITERIWLRAFGTTPKFAVFDRKLQIRSGPLGVIGLRRADDKRIIGACKL